VNKEETIKRRGLMLVLSSPSGAGKTTISREILKREPAMTLSISATTRQPRPGEVEGKDYFFVTAERFSQMVGEDAFLEHARVFENRYGTPRAPVEAALSEGRDVLFDIDWQAPSSSASRRATIWSRSSSCRPPWPPWKSA
jgi:guanylate kinase